VTSGSGSVQFTQQNTNDATLQYTAGAGGDGAGSTVEIEIGSVTTGDTSNFPPSTFTAGFSREDADTASATYEVTSSADTTAPDVDSVSATARSTDGNGGSGGNDAEEVEFSFGTSDNDAIDRVLLRVFDKSGNQIASRTVNSASSSSEVLSFPSQQMQGGGNFLDVNVTAFDASGNRRSCTTRLDSIGNTVDRGGFDCSSTRP
jgi:hypothetical protein